jgi:glyoxylase-like metal-dependent hydrolase (beta-lactamase superfamily II)
MALAADADVIVIDTMTAGMTGVTAGFLLPAPRPVLIECGPALTIDATISALQAQGLDADDLAYLVVTHVHLDHAGGAGDLLAAFPKAKVVVSPRGARHLSDPERLNASAKRVYGAYFDSVYGPCTPIDAERIVAPEHGEMLDLGAGRRLEILDTPGHAKHHIGVFEPDLGLLFTGDSVGVRLEGMNRLRPATPPADFNFETMLASLDIYRAREARTLYLAHFGDVGPPEDTLAEAEEQVRQWLAAAEDAWRNTPEHEDEVSHIAAMLEARFSDDLASAVQEVDEGTRRRLELLNDPRSNAAGMLRYLERRQAGTLTPYG